MKVEDLVIGKEYYFDFYKNEKGIFRGLNTSNNPFFEPTTDCKYYLEETDDINGFKGCIGFVSASTVTPVEP